MKYNNFKITPDNLLDFLYTQGVCNSGLVMVSRLSSDTKAELISKVDSGYIEVPSKKLYNDMYSLAKKLKLDIVVKRKGIKETVIFDAGRVTFHEIDSGFWERTEYLPAPSSLVTKYTTSSGVFLEIEYNDYGNITLSKSNDIESRRIYAGGKEVLLKSSDNYRRLRKWKKGEIVYEREWIEGDKDSYRDKQITITKDIEEVRLSDGSWELWIKNSSGNTVLYSSSKGDWAYFNYDKLGNKTHTVHRNGEYFEYKYNNDNLLEEVKNKRGWTKFTYDERGNIVFKIHSTFDWVIYSYNEQNKRTLKLRSNGDFEYTQYEGDAKVAMSDKEGTHYLEVITGDAKIIEIKNITGNFKLLFKKGKLIKADGSSNDICDYMLR